MLSHTNAGAQLASWCLQGGVMQSTTPGDPSPKFEDYCRSDLRRRKQKGAWPETLAWTPLSSYLQATAAPCSRMHPAQPGFHLPSMAHANICANWWWSQALGRGKVTGQVSGCRASPWHQNAYGISSIYSLSIICELLGFFLTFAHCLILVWGSPPPILWSIHVWRDRYWMGCWKKGIKNFRKEYQLENYIWPFNWDK